MLRNYLGYGTYEYMDGSNLPPLFLAYSPNPSDSGRIHSNVKQRWLNGESEIVEGMKFFRNLVDQAKEAIEQSDWSKLKDVMNANFEQRRKLYTGLLFGLYCIAYTV